MKRNLMTWAMALSLVLGGLGLASTSRAADEAAAPKATSKHHHSSHHHSHKKAAASAPKAEQPAK